ncbi:unnamed protein product [Durusdinium trenchii]|uniref:Uncharacterized protein n=1 Tax=Durusdinium trenchii TaxID=1381693 RepID=A0ABP0S9C4_9DINO
MAMALRKCIAGIPTRMNPLCRAGTAGTALRSFSDVSTDVKPTKKARSSLGSRLRSFLAGFTVAGTLSGYAIYYKVQWANEELAAMAFASDCVI